MSPGEIAAVVAAGFGAGIATASIGVASLVSFPVLVALGVPPVTANSSNTVGLVPAGLSGSFGYRRELSMHPRVTATVLVLSGVFASVGAFLLLTLPSSVFEAAVPWLILFACSLVATQPWISRQVRARRGPDHVSGPPRIGPGVGVGTAACGAYGGYFGAGQGVMLIAVLAFGLEVPMAVISALRTAAILASNLVATAIFVVVAPLDWTVVLLLGAGSVVGGYVGSMIGRHLPDTVLRALVVASGVTVATTMFLG